ncbi:Polyisoprenyl-teichoic acid--peptidoglycan teichoic acid transferase TagU [Paenibacillus plantiphilus]|uniref:Polyisoprenyl-teichoic acid--peptidoglycan teichoic acid transferase TagU n=1 Tax=Paenibacillus plantiphilus TaxID=2905650 RepID=A0ABN8H2F3_9BACL|nr:LCP family protein [Paenibacillus plantiphilus]CAH1218820.1 Polyisoprenyl-teichoic acid--peptidoglycan teichoic acid transferase TagU [Paenibacillus plantiphilus]
MARAKERTKKRRRPWLWALLGVLVIIVCIAGYFIYITLDFAEGFSKPKEESRFAQFEEKESEKPPEWEGTERVNILLMGGDNRGLEKDESARSDSMLVASIDPVTKQIHLLSVLRDTFVPIEGHKDDRVNTALALGGPNLAMKTIGNMLGLDIQYYVYTDFEGFKSLVDAIGGIDFYVEKNMNYVDNADGNRYDIHLKKGQQHLDGEKALMYVRFRHDAMSDFTRTERQRNVLAAVAKELQSAEHIINMKAILDSIQPHVESNLQPMDIFKLAQLGISSHMAGSAQVPPMELISDRNVGGASVLAIRDEAKLMEYVQDVLSKDSSVTDPATAGAGSEAGGGTDSSAGADSSDKR